MVRNGIDRIKEFDKVLAGKRLGLITSVSGVDCSLRSTIDILAQEYQLAVLFSPEHGVRGNVDAGGEVETYTDSYTGIPVYSLYRKESKRLTREMLKEIDAVVYDIQDLGVRYYTFVLGTLISVFLLLYFVFPARTDAQLCTHHTNCS